MYKYQFIKKIPKTTMNRYISKYYALNSEIDGKLPADWHPYCWECETNDEYIDLMDNYFLGEKGILFTKIKFSDSPVYIATFPRAVVDILYDLIKNNMDINNFGRDLKKEFLTEEEQKEMFDLLIEFNNHINIESYIKNQFPVEYYKMRYINA